MSLAQSEQPLTEADVERERGQIVARITMVRAQMSALAEFVAMPSGLTARQVIATLDALRQHFEALLPDLPEGPPVN